MLSPKPMWRVALAAAVACACGPAEAIVLSGTFSGVASAEPLPLNFPPPRPVADYDGAPISGSFEVNVPGPTFHQGSADGTFGYFLNGNGGYLSMSFRILGEQFDVHQASAPPGSTEFPSIIALGTGPALQTAQFLTDFRPRYSGGILTLSGPTGSLFSGLDPSTLHLDPSALPSLHAYFADSRAAMAIQFDATSVAYTLSTPVPEPTVAWLWLAGAIGVARLRRPRRRPVSPLAVTVPAQR